MQQFTGNSQPDLYPALAFSANAPQGVVLWSREFTGPHHDMYRSRYSMNQWEIATYVLDQQGTGRHWFFSIAHDPLGNDFLTTFGASQAGNNGIDEIDSRLWHDGWDDGPTRIGDGVNDDDINGAVRFAMDGTYALAIWCDEVNGSCHKRRIVGNLWDPSTSTSTWSAITVIQPYSGTLSDNWLSYHRSLAQDPVSEKWVLACHKRTAGSASTEPDVAEVAYRVGPRMLRV